MIQIHYAPSNLSIYDFAKEYRTTAMNLAFQEGRYTLVAEIEPSGSLQDDKSVREMLEYAFSTTQNGVVAESWSMDGIEGLIVKAPLHVINGRTYGLRSSSVGDIFIVNGVRYLCDMIGFTKIEEVQA